jgi:hypothetical protein
LITINGGNIPSLGQPWRTSLEGASVALSAVWHSFSVIAAVCFVAALGGDAR